MVTHRISSQLLLGVLLSVSLLPRGVWAVPVTVDSVKIEPNELLTRKQTPVVFTTHLSGLSAQRPTKVRLLRLLADGNPGEVALMRDDGTRGDLVKNDGTYTTTLKLKEPVSGLLCFSVEVVMPGDTLPVRSKPTFVKVLGKAWGAE